MSPSPQGALAQRYGLLKTLRDPFLQRARACSLLTIPSLVPPEGANGSTVYYTPFQSVGSRGVNSLSAKFLLAVLPPNAPSFRFLLDDATIKELTGDDKLRGAVEEALGQLERSILTDLETSSIRAAIVELLRHLLVAGNCLAYSNPETGQVRIWPLSSYVVKRSPSGTLLEVVVHEKLSPLEVPEKHRFALPSPQSAEGKKANTDDTVDLYTHVTRNSDGAYSVKQELNGTNLPDTAATYEKDACPWFAVRLNAGQPGDYCRSYVEELYGDLRSMEGLMKALVRGGAIMAKILFLLRPGATSTPKDLTEAETGAFRSGVEGDVSVVQAQKYGDFTFVLEMLRDLERRLGLAFLLNSSIQRNGERVTAEEIRLMVQDLDAALGGVYTSLAQEFQLPFIKVRMAQMQSRGKLPKLPQVAKKVLQPTITTGLEAIGRGNDLTRLQQFFGISAQLAQTPDLFIDGTDARKRVAAALQIDPKGLVKDAQTVAAEQAQQQKQAIMASAVPNMVNKVGDIARDQQQAAQAPA